MTRIKRRKKVFYQRLFIKYSTMTKFCKTSKWENRGDMQLDILPRKSSLGDEPHYLSTHGSENQANHTTNRWPITASQNCLSTNQAFIPFSKKKEKKACSAAVQVPTRWLCRSKARRKAIQPLVLLIAFIKKWHGLSHVCSIRLLIYSYVYLDKGWREKSGNQMAATIPETPPATSSTEALPQVRH